MIFAIYCKYKIAFIAIEINLFRINKPMIKITTRVNK